MTVSREVSTRHVTAFARRNSSAARAFLALMETEAFQEGPVKQGGVIPETMELWVGEEV